MYYEEVSYSQKAMQMRHNGHETLKKEEEKYWVIIFLFCVTCLMTSYRRKQCKHKPEKIISLLYSDAREKQEEKQRLNEQTTKAIKKNYSS